VIRHRTALLKALLALAIFGTVPSSVEHSGLNSVALGLVRLPLATIGMGVIIALRGREVVRGLAQEFRRHWPWLVAIGGFFGLHWLTYFYAIKLGGPSLSELGFCTYGAQLPLLGWACGFGRPSAATWGSVALATLGVWLCVGGAEMDATHLTGLAIAVLSGGFYAALPLLHQRLADVDPQLRTWSQFCFALPVFLLVAPWAVWSFKTGDVLLIIHLGLIVTLVAHYLWVQATTVMPIEVTGVVAYLQLPMSLTMNWLFSDTPLTARMIAGAACVVAANLLTVGLRARWSRRGD
jgi:drug/metabolite transporter (DMT)-like permease